MKKLSFIVIFTGILILTACTNSTTQGISTSTTDNPLLADCGNPTELGYKIVWCDEFNGNTIDPTKWTYETGSGGWGNDEQQFYTSRSDNSSIYDGSLNITAIKEDYQGSPYTSARLRTKGNFAFTYGRVEFRAMMPEGKGTWAALWMMPDQSKYGGWPNSGEIDVAEQVGYSQGTIYGTIHTEKYNHKNGTQKGGNTRIDDSTTAYHVYALEWYPRELDFYVDDQLYYTYTFNDAIDGGNAYNEAWPFDQDFYLIMNLAIGGEWGGAQGVDPNLNLSEMKVDYVRVYQMDFSKNDTLSPTVPTINENKVLPSTSSIQLSWAPSTDNMYLKTYQIFVNDVFVANSFSTSYTVKDLSPGTSYKIGVKAVDFADNVSQASEVTVSTLPLPAIPGTIGVISSEEFSDGKLTYSQTEQDYVLTGVKQNDSVTFTFTAPSDGNYLLRFRTSTVYSNVKVAVYTIKDGANLDYYSTTDVPQTSGYSTFANFDFNKPILLVQGENTIKIYARTLSTGDAYWLSSIYLEKIS